MTGDAVVTPLRYSTVLVDPPWPIRWDSGAGGRRRRAVPLAYRTLSIEEIMALPVGEIAAPAAHVYLWGTAQLFREGLVVDVARAWGFHPVGEIIWAKRNFGLGFFPRPAHEPLLVCRRGELPFRRNDVGSVQVWSQPRGRSNGGKTHSAKPDGSYDLIESASPGPYAELFARRARFGWDYPIGAQALGGAVVTVAR